MTDGFLLFSDMALSGLRALFGYYLICCLTDGQRKDGKKASAAGLGIAVFSGAAVLAGVFGLWNASEFYGTAGETLLLALCAGKLRRADGRMSLFFSVFYEIGFALWTFLAAAGAAVLLDAPSCLDEESIQGQAVLWGFYLLFSVLAAAFLKWKEEAERTEKAEKAGKQAVRAVSFLVVIGFVAVISLSEQRRITFPEEELSLWMMMSLLLLVAALTFGMRRQYEMERELLRLQTEQRELLERDYQSLNRSYGLNARLFHDFHNHMGALRDLLSRQKYEEALAYLDELQGPVREITEKAWTGDDAVDFLISSKAAEAGERQIRFQAEAEFPRHTNLRSSDLSAILGNLLDNALEAAGQVASPEDRFVSLVIRRMNQMLVIKVENSFVREPKRDGREMKTTKTEEGLHGWGLKSAQAAAQKYDGMVRTSWENGVFRAVATLSFCGQKPADGGHFGRASLFEL